MYEVVETPKFSRWLRKLKDLRAKAKIITRIDRVTEGNLGDIASVGGGVSEMRIFVGKGYRVYFTIKNQTVVLLLCGGDKSTQEADIKLSKEMANNLEGNYENQTF